MFYLTQFWSGGICHYFFSSFARVSSAAKSQSRCERIGMCQHFQGGSAESDHPRISPKGCSEASGANAVGQQPSRQGNCCWSTQVSSPLQSCGLQIDPVVLNQPPLHKFGTWYSAATSDSSEDDVNTSRGKPNIYKKMIKIAFHLARTLKYQPNL